MLAEACEATGMRGYDEIADHLFNGKLAMLVGLAIFGNCFGAAVGYVISIGDAMKWTGIDRWLVELITCTVVLLPLVCVYRINSLRYFSFMGVVGVGLLTFSTVYVLMKEGVSKDIKENHRQIFTTTASMQILNAFSTITFAFVCQYNVPSLYHELNIRTPNTMRKVALRSIAISSSLFIIAGVCGYLAFGYELPGSILISLQSFIDERDIFILIAVIGCVLSICIAHTLHVYPIRQTGQYMVRKFVSESLKENRLLAAGIGGLVVYLSLLVALFFPSFIKVIHLVGAFASSSIAYIFPPMFKIKLHGKFLAKELWLEYLMLSIGLVAGSLGTVVAITTIQSIFCVVPNSFV
jgi:amino acid permease